MNVKGGLSTLAFLLITIVAFSASVRAQSSDHAARVKVLHHDGNKPLGQSLGSFTEEQPAKQGPMDTERADQPKRHEDSDATADFISARKKTRSDKLFRPSSRSATSPSSQHGRGAAAAANRKVQSKRLPYAHAPDEHLAAEDAGEDDDDDGAQGDDDPITQRYDVDPATHPLP